MRRRSVREYKERNIELVRDRARKGAIKRYRDKMNSGDTEIIKELREKNKLAQRRRRKRKGI